jgi:glutathione S-transferase
LWTYWCNQIFKPALDRFKYGESRFSAQECEGIEDKLIQHVEKISRVLETSEWLVNNQFSLADIHIFPFVRQLVKIQPQPSFLEKHVSVLRWVESISSRPSFLETMR